jgi:hypothetical protein
LFSFPIVEEPENRYSSKDIAHEPFSADPAISARERESLPIPVSSKITKYQQVCQFLKSNNFILFFK